KVMKKMMTFLPQFVSAGDPAVTQKLLFLGFCFILIGMPVNASVVFAADWLASWLQNNKKVLRGMEYTFAGVFSVFAAKILLTQAK
ncbi:LysE family translocator, partial [Rhizobium leguminosarum]